MTSVSYPKNTSPSTCKSSEAETYLKFFFYPKGQKKVPSYFFKKNKTKIICLVPNYYNIHFSNTVYNSLPAKNMQIKYKFANNTKKLKLECCPYISYFSFNRRYGEVYFICIKIIYSNDIF